MPVFTFGRQGKRPYGFCSKVTAAVILGLCFIVIWSTSSSPSASVSSQRNSFTDILVPVPVADRRTGGGNGDLERTRRIDADGDSEGKREMRNEVTIGEKKVPVTDENNGNKEHEGARKTGITKKPVILSHWPEESEVKEPEEAKEEEDVQEEENDQDGKVDTEADGDGDDPIGFAAEESFVMEDEHSSLKPTGKKKKSRGPLFDSRAHHSWKACNVRTGHSYIPCMDTEGATGKMQRYRHKERSCPKTPPMCLVPLPEGYGFPVRWPESKSKVLYKNVAHPKLSAFIKTQNWLSQSNEYLNFLQNQSEFNGGASHYVNSIEGMVPDIEWGKNIRLVLDIGCRDASFGAALLDKAVLTLSWGLKDDEFNLAQVVLERGFPAIISILATRRLPFPAGVFDAIHCGGCRISWHLNGGKLLLEMNRILRPGGYFILSTEHDSIEVEEVMSKFTASICWNILAHRVDEISEVGIKIYQKPSSNDIYELRRKKFPPLCKEDEDPNSAWYAPIQICLHTVPAATDERGTEWPEEWPKRLETFPDWISHRDKLAADTEHWKAIVNHSYLNGMGIDWSRVRNVMDMKAVYGGFTAALESSKVWVMNVVPVHASDTLPIIFERGLLGIYHDWCESFSTYPRSYDLLHADHLFSRLKSSL
ncbi:probable methyltransferase PMT28 isoform X2 [Aristolochia californica]|uniref:probable methyltransferase PMT28 isoform X2 n=1 Tax=Aristolochia californica TaxID=171875 RepID=UPI0035DACCCD